MERGNWGHDVSRRDFIKVFVLHDGRPPVVREARYEPPPIKPWGLPAGTEGDWGRTLIRILGSLNVASKEWVIRQYDHEVQGGSAVKPLVGIHDDGPSDAAVLRPVLGSRRGLVMPTRCTEKPCRCVASAGSRNPSRRCKRPRNSTLAPATSQRTWPRRWG